MAQVAGYCLSMFIGFSLGLIGGGGSILTIPVLVFFFNIDPELAITYSLFIVGLTAICGSIHHYRSHNIDLKTVFLFGIPSVIILFIMRRWLLPMIPAIIIHIDSFVLSKSLFIMMVFSILMVIAGWSMIRNQKYTAVIQKESFSRLMMQGCITGAVTGFIGIGGGFIIVPSLVLFAGLSMKNAIGTSLIIIAVNCLVGILGNLNAAESLDYFFLATFSLFAIVGILAGNRAIRFIPDKKLKPVFGWMILAMSIIVFVRIFMQY
jgi:uncharacterized protein